MKTWISGMQHYTVGRRTIVYHFDEVNGTGLARYYKRTPEALRLIEFRGGFRCDNFAACRRLFVKVYGPAWYGKGFLEEANAVGKLQVAP